MKYVTGDASEKLEKLLRLPATGEEQDWEIELADPNRLDEFIRVFSEGEYNQEERFAFGALIVSSFDGLLRCNRSKKQRENLYDYLVENNDVDDDIVTLYKEKEMLIWSRILAVLKEDEILYDGIVEYWALRGEYSDSEPFLITPFFQRDFKE